MKSDSSNHLRWRRRKQFPWWLHCLWSFLIVQHSAAQTSQRGDLSVIMASIKNLTTSAPAEKLFLHLDKPWYLTGDTIWFKAYLFDATYLSSSNLSGVLYVELVNDSNRVEKRIMLPVNLGLAWGEIALEEKSITPGNYTLRAYTNWMRNFGDAFVFKRKIFVGDLSAQQWLVKLRTAVEPGETGDRAHINFNVTNFDSTPIKSRAMQVKVVNGNSSLYQQSVAANAEKTFDFSFQIPSRNTSNRIGIIVQDAQRNSFTRKIFLPIFLNRPQDIDLQFMPESGSLVAGIGSKIGFKAIGEDGKGINVSGKVVNGKGEQVAVFHSEHKGMGSFYFVPLKGEGYFAKLQLPMGTIKNYPLPQVKDSATLLFVTNAFSSDSLEIAISSTPDIQAAAPGFYLVGQSRGVVCVGGYMILNKPLITVKVAKKNFPSGIARFTLLDAAKHPVNERIAFIDRNDRLNIEIRTNKTSYLKRDSISLEIEITDSEHIPVEASISIAVTDDNQVKADSSSGHTVVSDMLLGSDLKGNVEEPGFYFQNLNDSTTWAWLDNLMLTQGWVGYDWNTILSPPKPVAYAPEPYFSVRGKVTNIFNKPVSNSGIVLLSKNPMLVLDTVTGTSGEFAFSNLVPQDTAIFLLQARNKKGKSFNVGIEVEEFKPPVFQPSSERTTPWFVNIDTLRLNLLSNQLSYEIENDKASGKNRMLEEVFVIGKKIIKDSKNLNGDGEADLTLTAADLDKAGKATLGDLMEKNVKGFRIGGKTGRTYMVFTMALHLVIDGVYVESMQPAGFSLFDYYKNFFDYYTAEDIKGIEVMSTGKYQMSYTSRFLPPLEVPWDHVFIEITTYGGQGPFLKKVPGIYLYKPMPFSIAKQFYAPKYNSDSVTNFVDRRSTIHWEPNVITDKKGMARVTFFSADHNGNYSIIINGSDMNGTLGTTRKRITVGN